MRNSAWSEYIYNANQKRILFRVACLSWQVHFFTHAQNGKGQPGRGASTSPSFPASQAEVSVEGQALCLPLPKPARSHGLSYHVIANGHGPSTYTTSPLGLVLWTNPADPSDPRVVVLQNLRAGEVVRSPGTDPGRLARSQVARASPAYHTCVPTFERCAPTSSIWTSPIE